MIGTITMAKESFDKKKMGICTDLALIAFESLALAVSLGFSITLREGEWFQRSGAIVVLISVILEIRQSMAKQPQADYKFIFVGNPVMTKQHFPTVRNLFHWIAWGGIVIGTLIWGYGDLFFE